ncbi:arginine deiminase-related protein [Flavobacteriaceae bacterium F08102]|nr:arginine deiminase-related protein [Flavobacteriaceae bacterium F08102]
MRQITDSVLMVRPVNFRMNEQTAVNNYYQKVLEGVSPENVQLKAVAEFDGFVQKLEAAGVNVLVVQDLPDPDTPDSIFPNNWVSFHENGNVGIYPMFAENRRFERREDILDIVESAGFQMENIIDYTAAEEDDVFLEGTGSLILDRVNRVAYCALSPRADEDLFIEFCEDFEFTPVTFTANQTVNGKRKPIYHTNVMMCIGETFCVICLASIDDPQERKNVLKHLRNTDKEIIDISEEQVAQFAGNMLELVGHNDQRLLVMSESAEKSLTQTQRDTIEKHATILSSPIYTIEACGGGSARCMIAEIFLPKVD